MSRLSTLRPVGLCTKGQVLKWQGRCRVGATEETHTDAPGAVAAVSAPAKGQRGGHRGGKQTQVRGTAGKQKAAHNYICFNHCKYGDKTWECADPDNCKFPGNE